MNFYLAAMAAALSDPVSYAWVITEDKIDNMPGACGPSEAPDELFTWNDDGNADHVKGRTWTFYLYDDDGEHYFTGKLTTTEESPEHDESGAYGALSAPLYEWGEAFGCTRIKWHGKPEWEIG